MTATPQPQKKTKKTAPKAGRRRRRRHRPPRRSRPPRRPLSRPTPTRARPSSTTCSGRTPSERPRLLDRRQPGPHRRRHGAGDHRGDVPVLQRQRRPAVRAQLPAHARVAERRRTLVRGNEVRIGGARVGAVDSIKAKRLENDTSVALIGLKLERDVKPLPKDSTVIIRPKSALGLKYVEITRGRSDQGFEDGDTIPLVGVAPDPGRVRRVHEHVQRRHAHGDPGEPPAVRRRVRGPRREHQHRARRAARAAARHPAGGEEPGQPDGRTSGASSTSSATPRASSRPPPRRRPACS